MQEQTKEYRPALIAPDARILVVDDNEMNLEVIEGLLKETKINVFTAESGQECIDILKERTFDLVFLDQMMPGMSGVKTLEKQHLTDNTPVIALTADAIVGARDNYLKEGFSDYLSKPVMYDALEAVIRKYLDDKKILNETQISELEKNMSQTKKPIILAISESPEELREIKALVGDQYKGVYVKDIASAEKYLVKKETVRES